MTIAQLRGMFQTRRNFQEARELMGAYVDDDALSTERERVEQHARVCPPCRQHWVWVPGVLRATAARTGERQ